MRKRLAEDVAANSELSKRIIGLKFLSSYRKFSSHHIEVEVLITLGLNVKVLARAKVLHDTLRMKGVGFNRPLLKNRLLFET